MNCPHGLNACADGNECARRSYADLANQPLVFAAKPLPDQRSTTDQLRDLIKLANERGMYDAADVIARIVEGKL